MKAITHIPDPLEAVIRSAEKRMTSASRAILRQVLGDAAYEASLREELALDQRARKDPPPPPGARKGLIPNWARRKWLSGRPTRG